MESKAVFFFVAHLDFVDLEHSWGSFDHHFPIGNDERFQPDEGVKH